MLEHSCLSELPPGLLAEKGLRQIATGSGEDHDHWQHVEMARTPHHGGSGISWIAVSHHSPTLNVIWSNQNLVAARFSNTKLLQRVSRSASTKPVVPTVSQSPPNAHEPRGVPKVFIDTCRRWGLGPNEQLILLGFERGDSIGRHVLQGRIRALSRDSIARAGYVIAISVGLAILYRENIAAENRWLRRKRVALGEKSPLDLMLDGDMIALISVNGLVAQDRGL